MTNTYILPTTDQPYVVAQNEGIHGHFLNNLATIKAAPGDRGLMSAVEFAAPQGFGPPLHVHADEDEIVVVLEGEVVFRSGETETVATEGAMAYLPRAIPHTFQVLSESARMLSVTARTTGSPDFDAFVADLSTPTSTVAIPEPTPVDGGRVAEVGAAHRITVLGPPPEAL